MGPGAVAPGRAWLRGFMWIFHLSLPVFGLWLLGAQRQTDVRWEHHPSHFWLVVAVAALNVGIAVVVIRAAGQRRDGRLYLVGLAFLAGAGFLGLHALATPGELLPKANTGFQLASPVGLVVTAVLAVASSFDFTPARSEAMLRRRWLLLGGLGLLIAAWAADSLLGLPPLSRVPDVDGERTYLRSLAVPAIALFAVAAWRYWLVYRRRPAVVLLSVLTAWALLAESVAAMAVSRNWHLSWWEWHILMAAGFGLVAYSAHVQDRREGSAAGLFDSVGTEATAARIRAEYGQALEQLVGVLDRADDLDEAAVRQRLAVATAGVASRFELTERQRDVLARAAQAMAAEREQLRHLDALVAVGRSARAIETEAELLQAAMSRIGAGFSRDEVRIGLVVDGALTFPPQLGGAPAARWLGDAAGQALSTGEAARAHDGGYVLPLLVKGRPAGVLAVRRVRGSFAERDRPVLESLAAVLSVTLENARLYHQIEGLFRSYLSPDVATALIADPAQAALGGAVVEVTALFADLRGFSTFSERSTPEQIVQMLNQYFGAATRCILAEGGTVVQFVGDALMALFNAPVRQPDHALRAARAALAMQAAVAGLAAEGWPTFRVGINTGPALVGNIGSAELRNFNAMGDAVNVAARLEQGAEPGQVVIGASTYELIGSAARVEPLGEFPVKGREAVVRAYRLLAIEETGERR
jgi:class 3 adenylate cyclase